MDVVRSNAKLMKAVRRKEPHVLDHQPLCLFIRLASMCGNLKDLEFTFWSDSMFEALCKYVPYTKWKYVS